MFVHLLSLFPANDSFCFLTSDVCLCKEEPLDFGLHELLSGASFDKLGFVSVQFSLALLSYSFIFPNTPPHPLPTPPPSESRVGFARRSRANECRRCVFPRAVILAKYGMDGKRDARSLESNSLKDHDVKEGDVFDDPRLDKLWNKVCEEELLKLHFASRHCSVLLRKLQVPQGCWVGRQPQQCRIEHYCIAFNHEKKTCRFNSSQLS